MLLSKPENEETYEALISLIENSQGRLAPIVVGCDDEILRDNVIDRYETEAAIAKISAYRITLGSEPNISAGLAHLKASETYLQSNGEAVFTVTGAEFLLWIKTHEEDAQSELDKFFGYLQWTREALREYPYPIVLWVPHRLLRQMSQRAPDFWSWRKAVLRFVDESVVYDAQVDHKQLNPTVEVEPEETFLPPPEELLEEIQQLEARSPSSASLATLYNKLGKVYAWRVEHGKSRNLEEEKEAAIKAFKQAIINQQLHEDNTSINGLTDLGNFLYGQSNFKEAIETYQESLNLSRKSQDRQLEAVSLAGLGVVNHAVGQYQRAIDFQQQALEIVRTIGDKQGEANALGNLGNAYQFLGQYQRAIDFQQQYLEIARANDDSRGEANALGNLGNAYQSLGQYQRAIDFYQQSLERKIGDKQGEAKSLGNLGNACDFLGQHQRATELHQQALDLARATGDKYWEASCLFNKAIALDNLSKKNEAILGFKQARSIYSEIQLDQLARRCDKELAKLQL
jgi:tetratricopeptide (TPR) repeat protein